MGSPTSFIILSYTIFILSYGLPSFSAPISTEFIYPNFTASNLLFVDHSGTFLQSRNGTFRASISNPIYEQKYFYFSIIHDASNSFIWSANRDSPISNSDKLTLTVNGITIFDQDGNPKWSTPPLKSAVSSLQLKENGNLVLLDNSNASLWESFDFPTDTIVIGQRLKIGGILSSSVSDRDLSTGKYRFLVTDGNGVLQWNGLTYWRLSMATEAFTDSSSPVTYMSMNSTGLYLFSGLVVVIQVMLTRADFRIAKLDSNGNFKVSSFSGTGKWNDDLAGPDDGCKIPNICDRIGLCSDVAGSTSTGCSCPSGFHTESNSKSCVPINSNYLLPRSCNSSFGGNQFNSSEIDYIKLGPGIEYFAIQFWDPVVFGVDLSVCQGLCSKNCSCLGFFHSNDSGSCYLINNHLGSMISNTETVNDQLGPLGYIKTIVTTTNGDGEEGEGGRDFPLAPLVLLPTTAFLLAILFLVALILWRRKKIISATNTVKLGGMKSSFSAEFDFISIPGLPVRFDYEELARATDNFNTQIGSGGFGAVYKGTLPDKTLVAVKKIINLGVQGKKEFCTEIATIGKVHHVNLVKLRGYCAEGQQRLLVYEFMNRGSLDRTLFRSGPVLEWQERFDIALGTARGLAYLHSGCEQKIIHCDIKPENILLHDHFQVKIADFGLSKLLSPEQSSHFTTMRGTRGYLAPEWLTSSAISDKTDVYSYGMVLLEIVSGRKNCSLKSRSQSTEDDSSDGGGAGGSGGSVYFPLFALEMHEQGRYLEIADPRLEGRVTTEDVEKLVRVALCCVHEEPMLRPSMATVVGMLEGGTVLGEPRVESLNFLRFYGRRFTESSMLAGSNNVFTIFEQANATTSSTSTSSQTTAVTHLSSQQISGPR